MSRRTRILDSDGRVWALLGPTNTGKTHRAIQRMLAHPSGMIGLPLRLLAREVYDRIVEARGADEVALVTGEEKISPSSPRYFVCTVEAMPMDRGVSFLAVDEIQLAGNRSRGHVFTERLLGARGWSETLFLGSDTMAPLLEELIPGIDIEHLPRLSQLTWAGTARVTRMPKRSALVAFNADAVYEHAERLRAVHGGAAVVLGALSPRARNAQVAMYQSGEVQHMVATDAIGMGLNMDVRHVAFTAVRKFDGRSHRALAAAELAQIAGRAGRYKTDGTFGTTRELGPLDEAVVDAIETHYFPPVTRLFWRNAELDFRTGETLLRSLERRPPHPALIRVRDEYDHHALEDLLRRADTAHLVTDEASLRLLWEVCRIPDYRKTRTGHHTDFLASVAAHLLDGGSLPTDWVAERIDRLDHVDGDIDALMARIAFVRTWTYLSHQRGWMADGPHWQERARAIEDRLSDALHEALTRRFVDERAMALVHRPGAITVADDGTVQAGETQLGRLEGLLFAGKVNLTDKALWNGLRRALRLEMVRRVGRLMMSKNRAIRLDGRGRLVWEGGALARLEGSSEVLEPRLRIHRLDFLESWERGAVRDRLEAWLREEREAMLAPLKRPAAQQLSPAGKGVMFELERHLGSVSARGVSDLVQQLSESDRRLLARLDVRIGTQTVYVQSLLKARWIRLRAALWSVHVGREEWPEVPDGRTAFRPASGVPGDFYRAIGYPLCGGYAVRADVLERVAAWLRRASRADASSIQPEEPMSWLAVGREGLDAVAGGLSYRLRAPDGSLEVVRTRSRRRRPQRRRRSRR